MKISISHDVVILASEPDAMLRATLGLRAALATFTLLRPFWKKSADCSDTLFMMVKIEENFCEIRNV